MIYIVRHGQTENNRANILLGRIDQPMDDTGREQAAHAAAWFKNQGIAFDRVYFAPALHTH